MEIHNMPPFLIVAQTRRDRIDHTYYYLRTFSSNTGPQWVNSLKSAKIYDDVKDMIHYRNMIMEYWEMYGNNLPISLCNLPKHHKIAEGISELVEL